MKVLVLVQSTDNPFYKPLIETQQQTWDSIDHPDVTVVYYKPGITMEDLEGNILKVGHQEVRNHAFFILAKAIRYMLRKDYWDYVVKTDNSVYINKELIYNLLLDKPREKYFGGIPITHKDLSEESKKFFDENFKFLWGEMLVMSRDTAVHVVDTFNKAPLKGVGADDINISHILKDYCVWDESLKIAFDENDLSNYAYRVRRIALMFSPMFVQPTNIQEIIDSDITTMNKIHNLITNGKDNNREILSEETQSEA
jgi:hypothetical protein